MCCCVLSVLKTLCFNQLPFMNLWYYDSRLFVLIDYCIALIDCMLDLKLCFGVFVLLYSITTLF